MNAAGCKLVVSRRRGFALVLALLLITLLMATVTQLAARGTSEALVARRLRNTLAHQLAVDSALLRLERELGSADSRAPLEVALDRDGFTSLEWTFGEVQVHATLRDDAAKLNPVLWNAPAEETLLRRKIDRLGARWGLSGETQLRPVRFPMGESESQRYWWFDQLLTNVAPEDLFRWDESDRHRVVWSDLGTFWGDGKIALRRVSADLLEVALEDLRPGLGQSLLSACTKKGTDCRAAALARVDGELRERVAERIIYDARRYSLECATILPGDTRRWYVVVQVKDQGMDVLQRSPLSW